MEYFYVVCAVIGWGLVSFQLVAGHGGHDIDTHADFGGDIGGDVGGDFGGDVGGDFGGDVGGDAHVHLEADGGGAAAHIFQFLRFSSLVFFLAFFGTAGLVFGWLGGGSTSVLIAAVLVGLVAGGINSIAFNLLRRGESSSELRDSDFVGRRGKVVVPMTGKGPGRVMIDVGGRPMRLPARPHPAEDRDFEVGAEVLVVSYKGGTAYVDVLDPELT